MSFLLSSCLPSLCLCPWMKNWSRTPPLLLTMNTLIIVSYILHFWQYSRVTCGVTAAPLYVFLPPCTVGINHRRCHSFMTKKKPLTHHICMCVRSCVCLLQSQVHIITQACFAGWGDTVTPESVRGFGPRPRRYCKPFGIWAPLLLYAARAQLWTESKNNTEKQIPLW